VQLVILGFWLEIHDKLITLKMPSSNTTAINFIRTEIQKSKETYRKTRGLNNLEMKHVGELANTGVFLKAVKTSWVRTTQGRNYLTKRRLFSLAFGAHISQNS